MPNNFKSFYRFAVHKMRETDKKVEKFLDSFLGLGVCRKCGHVNNSILGYCDECLDISREIGYRLINVGGTKIIKPRSHDELHA